MSNILAAIGSGQLQVLDERVKRRREIFEYYKNALGGLPGIEFMPEPEWSYSNRWLTVVLITPEEFGADREKIRLTLEAENIESRPVWKPMHLQPVFDCQSNRQEPEMLGSCDAKTGKKPKKRYRARVVGGSVAEDLFDRGLSLPSGTALDEDDLDRIIMDLLRVIG
jgi:dTDP-4-amino-4,6-dideoxygalactose transaminase